MTTLKLTQRYTREQMATTLFLLLSCMWVLTSYLMFISKSSFTLSANPNTKSVVAESITGSRVDVGSATKNFLNNLEATGLNPVPVADDSKRFFSVTGKIITVANDNIEVFEYKNSDDARHDATLYQDRMAKMNSAWKNSMQLYTKDNLLIFYMGTNQTIVSALKSIL